jgi:hypothetical protein
MKLRIWILGLGIIAGMMYVTGCGQNRWHPTDPRTEAPSTDQMTIDDRWSGYLGTTVTASVP